MRPSGEGVWRISEAVNASRSFHVVEGLEPGVAYTVRLIAKHLFDNASVFEDVIQTRVRGEAPRRANRQLVAPRHANRQLVAP